MQGMEASCGAEGEIGLAHCCGRQTLKGAWYMACLSPCVLPLHIPLCLLASMIRRDIAGINETGQSHDNYLTM